MDTLMTFCYFGVGAKAAPLDSDRRLDMKQCNAMVRVNDYKSVSNVL